MEMRRLPFIPLLFVSLLLAGVRDSLAHQPGLSTLSVTLGTNRVAAQLILSWQEAEALLPLDLNRDRSLSDEEFAASKQSLARIGEPAISIISDGRMLSLKSPVQVHRDDLTGIRFEFLFESTPTRVLTVTSEILSDLPRGHSQIVTVQSASGSIHGETVLDREKPTVDIPLYDLEEHSVRSPIRQFFWLGIKHIVTGWDHLAFLFGLLAVGGKLRDAVKIITSFTIAHSLTLILATLDLIHVPSSVIEPLIAASIVYVAFENMLRTDFRNRWMITFGLGLIHGCGFASLLRELRVGENGTGIVAPLVSFNLGVEAGQLAIAAVMLPLIWRLRGKFSKRWVAATSILLILIGSYFLLARLWPFNAPSGTESAQKAQIRFSSASMKSTKEFKSCRWLNPAASLRWFNRSSIVASPGLG